MSKVVFYEPASLQPHVYDRFRLPRLGTAILGTIAKQAGHQVKVFVESIQKPTFEELCDADVVGISTITSTAMRSFQVADELRGKGIKVMIGGPHVTFLPDEALNHADYVMRGEGERSILPLLDAMASGKGFESVQGLSYRDAEGKAVHNPLGELIWDLDEIPDPDWDLLQGGFKMAWTSTVIPVQTARGCPYDCYFCSVTKMFGRKVRNRSVGRVLDELERLANRRSHIFFYDDHFAANRKRLRELMEGILERKLKFGWSAQVRADLARDEDLLDLMRKAGCNTVYIGMESVNPETLKAYNKGQTVDEMESAIAIFHKHKIRLHGMFVLGADTDTPETVMATADFAARNRIQTVQFLILTPLPGTPQFKELEDTGRLVIKDWTYYDAHHVVFEPKLMSAYELQKTVMKAYHQFYSIRRVVSEAVRLNFFEALIKVYARRIERNFENMSDWFIEGLQDGLESVNAMLESGQAPVPNGA